MRRALRSIAVLATLAALGVLAGASPALASETAWWHLSATPAPTLLPRTGPAQLTITATDLGYGEVNATREHVTLVDTLPEGVRPVSVTGEDSRSKVLMDCVPAGQTVTCTFTEKLAPYESLFVRVDVEMEEPKEAEGPEGPLQNALRLEGGETPAPPALKRTLKLQRSAGEATPFGVEAEGYELTPEAGGGPGEAPAGTPDTQAGSHPFQFTTTIDFDQTLRDYSQNGGFGETGFYPSAPALPHNLHFKLPPGLIGDPGAVPQCTGAQFATILPGDSNLCPADSAIGVASLLANVPDPLGFEPAEVPVFNLTPGQGEPARFGFEFYEVQVVLDTALSPGGDLAVEGVEVSTTNTSEAGQVLASAVSIWGVPGDPRHDSARGWECLAGGLYEEEGAAPCKPLGEREPTAFLTLPTACEPLRSSMSGDSWPTGEPGNTGSALTGDTSYTSPFTLTGCPALAFEPKLSIEPEQHAASTPTGLTVGVEMRQPGLLTATGRAESALRETTVTLPEGLLANPAAANALRTCSAKEFDFLDIFGHPFGEEGVAEERQTSNETSPSGPGHCPEAAKVGTVQIQTPLLAHELSGEVFLAAQNTNPFRSPLALYLTAEDPTDGVLVKLAGEVTIDEATGQLTTTFRNTPQVPFSSLKLDLFGEARASLATPARCGDYSASTTFVPWSGGADARPEPGFAIESGPGGGACPGGTLPFSPSVTAGPISSQAAGFSPFVLRIGQGDGSQPLKAIDVQLPPGDSALLADVTPCSEAQALAEACGAESEIGHVRALAGLGSEPVSLPGPGESDPVYLTGPLRANASHGASPFGILARVHAKAGPFDLGWIKVFSTLTVNPNTAAATVSSEQVPDFVDGVPSDLKQLEVVVERPGDAPFTLNPTNCGGTLAIGGSLSGYEGGSESINQPFPVSGCAGLPFKPDFTAAAGGHASKTDGTGLTVKVTSAGLGQANIAKVLVQLPKQLPSRLTTIQKACVAATFESTPTPGAACDEGSVIGSATVHTPILKNPVSGPAYLVSHGGAAFPDIEFVLQGEGITLVLDGHTDIKNGITYSKFESVPDQPFTSFETVLPAGPHSALTANVAESKNFDLCGEKLSMPTTIVAQNGATIEQSTPIALEGCGQVKGVKTKKLTRAQKLAAALKACRHKYKHSKAKRVSCEKAARKKFGPQKKTNKAKVGHKR